MIWLDKEKVSDASANEALTQLANRGNYETAYLGIDALSADDGTFVWETLRWQELLLDHNTNTDWIEEHSFFLT